MEENCLNGLVHSNINNEIKINSKEVLDTYNKKEKIRCGV